MSSSVMETTASVFVPPVTPGGNVPNVSCTDSSSSSSVSWVAVKVKLFSVSPVWKVRAAGTPE